MSRRKTLSLMVVASMLVACGGGGDASPDDISDGISGAEPPPASTTVPTNDDPVTTDPPVTDPPTTASSASTTTIVIDVTDAAPWSIELSDPTGDMLVAWADQPALVHNPTEPPDGFEAQLAWVYADLIELWRGNPRLVALGMNDAALERPHRETAPAAAIDLIGAAGALLRDSYAIIAADAELAIANGSTGQELFSIWSDYARRWLAATELVRVAMAEARDFSTDDQACFVITIDGDDFCEGPAAESAFTLMTDLDELFQSLDDLDIDEVTTYTSDLGADECAAWDAAVAATGLTAGEELQIWIGLDDNDLDRTFVGLSECGWQDDGEEAAEPDDAADRETFLTYLTAVAEAIVASGYDETVYDFGSGAEDERRYYESTSAEATQSILIAARNSASELWLIASDAEFATKLYVVASITIDDWTQLGNRELAWDDLGNQLCDGWAMVTEGYSAEQLTAIAAAVDELGLDGTLVPEGCS